MNTDRKKYFTVLFITVGIFLVVFAFVSMVNKSKRENIDDLQRKITIDLIATETKFDLLKTVPCKSVQDSLLSKELHELTEKLAFAENNQGSDNPAVQELKKNYTLLQVKDYLLMQEIFKKCDVHDDTILYFYNSGCDDCRKQGYVLTEFKQQYPNVRIYSFDVDLDFSVIDTFVSLYDFKAVYPTMIIHDTAYQNMLSVEDLEKLFSNLVIEKKQAQTIEQGIDFIKNQELYADIKREDIVFDGQELQVYRYRIVTDNINESFDDSKGILVELIFDTASESFSIKKNK